MRVVEDILYISNLKLDLYLPDSDGFPLLVYFHGGCLEGGDKADLRCLSALAERGIGVAVPNYHLYPDAQYPAFVEDAGAAVAWVFRRRGEVGNPSGLWVGGSSAGAHLAMQLAFNPRWLGVYGLTPDKMAGFLFDGGQPTVHFNVLREYGADPRQVVVDERAPLYHVTEALYPPMLFLCAEDDLPGRLTQNQLMLDTLRHFGCDRAELTVIPGFGHSEYVAQKVFADTVANFINAVEC